MFMIPPIKRSYVHDIKCVGSPTERQGDKPHEYRNRILFDATTVTCGYGVRPAKADRVGSNPTHGAKQCVGSLTRTSEGHSEDAGTRRGDPVPSSKQC